MDLGIIIMAIFFLFLIKRWLNKFLHRLLNKTRLLALPSLLLIANPNKGFSKSLLRWILNRILLHETALESLYIFEKLDEEIEFFN